MISTEVPLSKNKKDKRLKKTNTLISKSFKCGADPSRIKWNIKNKKNKVPYHDYKIPAQVLRSSIKYPKKYNDYFERLMNTMPNHETSSWGYFSNDGCGQGNISSQAGEIMVMMSLGMENNISEIFFNSIKTTINTRLKKDLINIKSGKQPVFHTQNHDGSYRINNSKMIIDLNWCIAAENNKRCILKWLEYNHGPKYKINAVSWDVVDEVISLGLCNFSKNKKNSTDLYMKIHADILVEISLKKSTKVNFSNSRVGIFKKWDSNLSAEINQDIYVKEEKTRLLNIIKDFEKIVKRYHIGADKDVDEQMKRLKIASVDLLFDKNLRGENRRKNKTILSLIKYIARNGNSRADKFLINHANYSNTFAKKCIDAIVNNKKIKHGMINSIRTNFPIKSICDGKEIMVVGSYLLDRNIIKCIFGTHDYNKIKDHLVIIRGKHPSIGYKVSSGAEIIPIALIEIRENGVGYGGDMRLDMELHSQFAQHLKIANKLIYDLS